MKKYRHFVFDLDGTLFRVPVDWKSVRKELSSVGIELSEKIFLFPQLEKMKNISLLNKALTIIDRYELLSLKDVEEIDESISVIKSISLGASISLVTLQGIKFCTSLLSMKKISDIFVSVTTREFSLRRKEQLERAIKISGEKKEKILFVGDRETDVLAAKELQMDVAVVGNYTGTEPTYYLRSLKEIIPLSELR